MLHCVLLVAGVDTLGAVATIEIHIHLQAANLLHDRDALVFGNAGIDGALIDHHITLADDLTDRGAGSYERSQVGVVVCIHGGRDGHHIEVAVLDLLNVAGADETVVVDSILQDVVSHLKGSVVTGHKRIATLLVHIKTDSLVLGRKQAGKGKSYIAQSNNANLCLFHCILTFI